MTRIFIVEDDEDIRELVIYALESASFSSRGFESAADFYKALEGERPDLVLLDIMMPEEDGLSILGKLRQTGDYEDLPVILLTAKSSEADKVKGLNLGADDYLTKPFGVMELIARVNAVLRRSKKEGSGQDLAKDRLSYQDIEMELAQRWIGVAGDEVNLTYLEFELLKFLMENKNVVLTRDRLMDAVWDYDRPVESRTVDMHIKTLRKKLGPAGTYIKTVRNVGYKIGD